jgi:hypothetical protein
MKWALPAWPVGQYVITPGTIVEGVADPDGGIAIGPISPFDGTPLPLPLPIDATPLDEEAAVMMLRWYDESQWHRLGFPAGLNVEAAKMKAAAMASTPRYPRHYVPSTLAATEIPNAEIKAETNETPPKTKTKTTRANR